MPRGERAGRPLPSGGGCDASAGRSPRVLTWRSWRRPPGRDEKRPPRVAGGASAGGNRIVEDSGPSLHSPGRSQGAELGGAGGAEAPPAELDEPMCFLPVLERL